MTSDKQAMSKCLDILILAFCPPRNRQGVDLNRALLAHAYRTKLIQLDVPCDSARSITGITTPKARWLWHLHLGAAVIRLKMLAKAICLPHRVTIVLNLPALLPGVILKVFFGTRLIFYTLEHSPICAANRWLLRRFCDAVIDVEENRLSLLLAMIGRSLPSFVLYNIPHRVNPQMLRPRMRVWLAEKGLAKPDDLLLVYSGSYQKYCYLETLVEWAGEFPDNVKLILMMTEVPEHLRISGSRHVIIVPPQTHEELYDWLSDCDVSLLPYEGTSDNIRFCSPQKLFDSLACGVPVLGSCRPLIQKIVDQYGCGQTIDFTDHHAFTVAWKWFQKRRADAFRSHAFRAHGEFNYETQAERLIDFLQKNVLVDITLTKHTAC
jgi:glycosyltransferase involved in cell wall biosynthesis